MERPPKTSNYLLVDPFYLAIVAAFVHDPGFENDDMLANTEVDNCCYLSRDNSCLRIPIHHFNEVNKKDLPIDLQYPQVQSLITFLRRLPHYDVSLDYLPLSVVFLDKWDLN